MNVDETNKFIEQLKRHEGFSSTPYRCSQGKLTVGYGRNLDDVGISEEEAEVLLTADIKETALLVKYIFPWANELVPARCAAFLNFVFNVGIGTAKKFAKSTALMEQGKYEEAADEFLRSKWADQVGQRAIEITEQIRTGKWQ